jgi:hypothetical protein
LEIRETGYTVREDQPQFTVGIDPDSDSDPDTDGNQEQRQAMSLSLPVASIQFHSRHISMDKRTHNQADASRADFDKG